jgi:hypothetical protein
MAGVDQSGALEDPFFLGWADTLGWKGLPRTNTLAFFCLNIETKKIDFVTVTACGYVIKHFTIVIYKSSS